MPESSLQAIAAALEAQLIGDAGVIVSNIGSIASAEKGTLVFADSPQALAQALASKASAVLTGEFAGQNPAAKPLLICKQPKLAFAQASRLLHDQQRTAGVHRSAIVEASAKLGGNIGIGACSVIGKHAVLGEGSIVGANTVIEAGAVIGRDCRIGHNVTIHSGCHLGDRVVIQSGTVLGSAGFGYVRDNKTGSYQQFPQIGILRIEDNVEIGANCTVDRGALDQTVIRRGAKLDNLVHVGHNVEIGENVVIAAQTGISGSSVIGTGAIVGGQVGIADHVTIEGGVILGAQSGIPSKKVVRGKGIVFWGTPARPIREYLKELAVLARLAKRESK